MQVTESNTSNSSSSSNNYYCKYKLVSLAAAQKQLYFSSFLSCLLKFSSLFFLFTCLSVSE